jgi:hypothetical protein
VNPFIDFNGNRAWLPRDVTADVLVCVLILALGALQFVFPLRADDFIHGDTIYIELATSIIERGSYEPGFNYVIYPPGLPVFLAFLCKATSCSYAVLVRSMALFATLGLIASYQFLRRAEGRGVAAAACLLIASSPEIFHLSTRWVYSDLPYFFASMATLVLAARVDRAVSPRAQLLFGLLCSITLVSSLLFRSSGVALIAGLAGWLAVGSLWTDRATRSRRLRKFSYVLLAAIVVQAAWMVWASKHETVEWPMLEGHPRSYVSQLIVKSGIQPELGIASISEIPSRVSKNLAERAVGLMQLVTRKAYIESAWYSPLVLGSVLLVAAGLLSSMRGSGGGLAEWYFISYESMYLLWPWPFEMRFLLPVAPLACLYLWRGGATLGRMVSQKPQTLGTFGAPIGLLAGVSAASAGWTSDAMQPKVAAIFWAVIAALSVWMVWSSSSRRLDSLVPRDLGQWALASGWTKRLRLPQITGAVAVAGLVMLGITSQLRIGRQNLEFDVTKDISHGTIVAAQWIANHTVNSAVIMAVRMDVVHHYANRKVVYFPSLSNPQLLMEGIRRLGVDFVIVTNGYTYYLPSEDDCINPLMKLHPQAFRIAHEGPGFRIVEVVHEGLPHDVN